MKKACSLIYIIIILVISSPLIGAQFPVRIEGNGLSLAKDSVSIPEKERDSTILVIDSITVDSIAVDSVPKKKSALEAAVD